MSFLLGCVHQYQETSTKQQHPIVQESSRLGPHRSLKCLLSAFGLLPGPVMPAVEEAAHAQCGGAAVGWSRGCGVVQAERSPALTC